MALGSRERGSTGGGRWRARERERVTAGEGESGSAGCWEGGISHHM